MSRGNRRRVPGRGRVLEVVDLSVSFGAVQALNGVSLHVGECEFVGLIGPNGAGKTTLFNAVTGFVRPDAGRVRLAGRRITDWSATRRARAGMGRTFQNVGLDKPATVAENLRTAQEASALRRELLEYLSSASGFREAEQRREREEIVEYLGLGDVLNAPVNHLPIGSAKLVELACVLLRRPTVLLLDEPSSGLSPEETARLGEVLQEVQQARGIAVLMIEHNMSLAMNLCEYLYVLDFGSLITHGTPQAVRTAPAVIEAYLGREAV